MINIAFPEIDLLKKIRDILRQQTLYILGAGVSVKYTPLRYDLYESAKVLVKEASFDLPLKKIREISTNDKSRFKILGSPHHETQDGKLLIDYTKMDFHEAIIHTYPTLLELMCALTYSLDVYPEYCPEYQIFNLSNKNSVIINLNHDNLAEFFIKRPSVISLHGTITPEQKRIIQEFIPHMLDLDIKKVFLKNVYLATQEDEHLLLNRKEYKNLLKVLENNNFQYIVIIGYSFFKKTDYDIYDIVTYDRIRSYMIEFKPQVIIIDPNPYFVADIFSKGLNLSNIKCLEVSWHSFTHAFYQTNRLKNSSLCKFDLTDQRRFIKFYNDFLGNDLENLKRKYPRIHLDEKSYS